MPESKALKSIMKSVKKNYLGEKVPSKYQSRYGKRYDTKDIKSFSYAIAKSRGIKLDKKGGK